MITWIGPNVGIMKKAKVGPQREELISILPGLQFFLGASEQDEVDMTHLAARLLAAGGAYEKGLFHIVVSSLTIVGKYPSLTVISSIIFLVVYY